MAGYSKSDQVLANINLIERLKECQDHINNAVMSLKYARDRGEVLGIDALRYVLTSQSESITARIDYLRKEIEQLDKQ